MVSHGITNFPVTIRNEKRNSDFLMAVVDPRRTETAQLANIHLALWPGTDALLFKATPCTQDSIVIFENHFQGLAGSWFVIHY